MSKEPRGLAEVDPQENEKPYVLVIDDDEPIHELISASLSKTCNIDHASDAFEAQKKVNSRRYQLLICDVKMPMISGLILVEEFQKKQVSVPVIFISGEINHEISKQALSLGAFNILTKPFSLEDLQSKVADALLLSKELETSPGEEPHNQELGYYYNLLKPHYYDCDKIIYYLQSQNIPLSTIIEELNKKEMSGTCMFDDPELTKSR